MGTWVFTLWAVVMSLVPRVVFLDGLPLVAATTTVVKCQGSADSPAADSQAQGSMGFPVLKEPRSRGEGTVPLPPGTLQPVEN